MMFPRGVDDLFIACPEALPATVSQKVAGADIALRSYDKATEYASNNAYNAQNHLLHGSSSNVIRTGRSVMLIVINAVAREQGGKGAGRPHFSDKGASPPHFFASRNTLCRYPALGSDVASRGR